MNQLENLVQFENLVVLDHQGTILLPLLLQVLWAIVL